MLKASRKKNKMCSEVTSFRAADVSSAPAPQLHHSPLPESHFSCIWRVYSMGTATHLTETASQLKHTLCVFSLSAPKPSPSPQELLCSGTSTFQSIRELYPGATLPAEELVNK